MPCWHWISNPLPYHIPAPYMQLQKNQDEWHTRSNQTHLFHLKIESGQTSPVFFVWTGRKSWINLFKHQISLALFIKNITKYKSMKNDLQASFVDNFRVNDINMCPNFSFECYIFVRVFDNDDCFFHMLFSWLTILSVKGFNKIRVKCKKYINTETRILKL